MKKSIPLSKIILDAGTQIRAQISEETIAEYAERLRAGDRFPPVILFSDKKKFWLADGFHRYHAHKRIKAKSIQAEIHPGTLRDAILFAIQANATHGLKRTNEDKRSAVLKLLKDKEWTQWSNREIAKRCFVSPGMVDQLRKSLPILGTERTFKSKHGTIAQMAVANIGKKAHKSAPSKKVRLTLKTQKLLKNYSVSRGMDENKIIEEALKAFFGKKLKQK